MLNQYDTIRYGSLTWTEKLSVDCDQLNLARVSKNKKYKKEETKTNKTPVPL